MRFNPNDAGMFGQRQHHPVAKMFIKRDEHSFFPHCAFKNLRVVCPRLSDFRGANNIMSHRAQKFSQLRPQHLIKVNAHGGLSCANGGDFRVQNGTAGVIQSRLNIRARQFRVAV